jgi:hypothetical protein
MPFRAAAEPKWRFGVVTLSPRIVEPMDGDRVS